MKIDFQSRIKACPFTGGQRPCTRSSSRGSAVVIVLVLLTLVTTLIASNAVTLRRMKVELQLLEEKQKRVLEERWHPITQPP